MKLNSSFVVARSVEDTWAVLTDLVQLAPCLPGARLDKVDGEAHIGTVKVKVGPITAQYKGEARFVERDAVAHRAVLAAKGRDTRGAGNASARIVAELSEGDGGTLVVVDTDLTITGKVAQFGRGVMADVSAKLMQQFADNLAELMESSGSDPAPAGGAASDSPEPPASAGAAAAAGDGVDPSETDRDPATAAATTPGEGFEQRPDDEIEAVDLLQVAGVPVLKRLIPVIIILIAVILLLVWLF